MRLEYSTDGFVTAHAIVASTPNDGAHAWTLPDDPSNSVRVRVVDLGYTVDDASDKDFTIAGPQAFEASDKTVSDSSLEGGEAITYTIVLYEEVSAAIKLTDTVPAPLTCLTDTIEVAPSWKDPAQYVAGEVRWSGVVTGTAPVTLTFVAQVPVTTTTWVVANHAQVSRDGAAPADLSTTSILNGFRVYLPLVLKGP